MTLPSEVMDAAVAHTRSDALEYIIFDITDYLNTCLGRNGITGIQRVQQALIKELYISTDLIEFVFIDFTYGRVWKLPRDGIADLVNHHNGTGSWLDAKATIAETLRDSAKLFDLTENDIFVNLGTFWPSQYNLLLERSLIESGCAFISLVYDLIPIDHPELCETMTVHRFQTALPLMLLRATAVVTISAYTEMRLQAYGVRAGLQIPPTYVLKLSHQLPQSATSSKPLHGSPTIIGAFVLTVGTLEPRKNHLMLVEAWSRLAQSIDNLPILVIVGKIGWINPDILKHIQKIAYETGKIIILGGVSDAELESLYSRCLFTVLLSLDEGWGLPVGESLSFGKVCLAARTGALPEAGGEFAVYADPHDLVGIEAMLRTLILDRPRRNALEAQIRQNFSPRSWSTVVVDLLAISDQFRKVRRPGKGYLMS